MSSFKLNPKHKGWCTPMTKKTCTGKRRTFAMNAKHHFKKYANGGQVPVEVEGNEVAQSPEGELMEFQGPSHEAGGINTTLPEGTEVFSDRISIDGKTMAERKKARERKFNKLGDVLKDDPTNAINRSSAKRTSVALDQEEEMDKNIQRVAAPVMNPKQKMAGGGVVGGYLNTAQQPLLFQDTTQGNLIDPSDYLLDLETPGVTGGVLSGAKSTINTSTPSTPSTNIGGGWGNALGMVGTAVNSIAPLLTTLANRRGDTPNVNSYKNFGKDALDANSQAIDFSDIQDKNAKANAKIAGNTAKARNRGSAQGIGTQRALDSITDMQTGAQDNTIDAQHAKEMIEILGQRATLENTQDQYVMGGEQQRDISDRRDRDAFFTNLNKDMSNLGTGLQYEGRALNQGQLNQDESALIGELSKYGMGYTRDRNGKLKLTKIK